MSLNSILYLINFATSLYTIFVRLQIDILLKFTSVYIHLFKRRILQLRFYGCCHPCLIYVVIYLGGIKTEDLFQWYW